MEGHNYNLGLNGWILSFYLDGNQSNFNDIQCDNDSNRTIFKYLSWSPYDRLDAESISNFKDFFDSQFSYRWDGVAQQMHLIPEFPTPFSLEAKKYTSNSKNINSGCLIKSKKNPDGYGLNCIVTVRLSSKVRDILEFRESIYKSFSDILGETLNQSDYDWGGFNSLGAENIVFIFLANDIKTFDIIINILANAIAYKSDGSSVSLFSSISSFLGFNKKGWSGDPHSNLIIRLTLKSPESYNDVVNILSQNNIDENCIQKLVIGKCILDLRIPSSEMLLSYFHDNNIFNGTSDFYKKYISVSRSYWVSAITTPQKSFSVCCNAFKQQNTYENLDNDISTQCNLPMVQFILKEYKRMIKSTNSAAWSDILYEQYLTFCSLVNKIDNHNIESYLYVLIDQVRLVLQHIRQATTPVAEVPYHNYAYAGSYNDILKMYQGIITALMEVGKCIPHDNINNTKQHKITFCVDFESARTIHSTMFSKDRYSDRFIVFHLPYNAFTDINLNVKLLVHEVFHFIAPYSRCGRNVALINLWSDTIIRKFIDALTETLLSVVNPQDNSLDTTLPILTKQLLNDVPLKVKIVDRIKKYCPGFEDYILHDFLKDNNSINNIINQVHDIYIIIIKHLCETNSTLSNSVAHMLKQIPAKDQVFNIIYSACCNKLDSEYNKVYLRDDLVRTAKVSKEAFCDYNMLRLLGLDLNDYVNLFFVIFSNRLGDIFNGVIDMTKLEELNIHIGSYETRMCQVFDLFCYSNSENSVEVLKKKLSYTSDLSKVSNHTVHNMKTYAIHVYSKYVGLDTGYRQIFAKLFYEIAAFWDKIDDLTKIGNESSNALYQTVHKLRKINKLDQSIALNVDFINTFVDYVPSNNKIPAISYTNSQLRAHWTSKESNERTYNYVYDIGSFIKEVCKISNQLTDSGDFGNEPCWYRGLCSKDFNSLPSLIRSYDCDWLTKIGMSPYAYQTKMLKDAYYLTMNMPDLWTAQLHGIAEHTCCLQHYGMKTNLLDFSLDMLVALHFALNPDDERDQQKLQNGTYTPKVIIFNPARYSKAIMSLAEGRVIDATHFRRLSPVLFDAYDIGLNEYFVGDMSAEYALETTRIFDEEKYVPNNRINKYPKPIIIRHSNNRVLSQSGIFLAYNLFSGIDYQNIKKNPFGYLDLNSIQREYFNLFPSNDNTHNERFFAEVYIRPDSIMAMQDSLKTMRITKGRMYPELFNIFSGYMKEQEQR